MAERNDLPRIAATKPPSPLNHTAAKWGLGGGIIGSMVAGYLAHLPLIATGALTAVAPFLPAITLGVGYVAAKYGAKLGIAKQERELTEGRAVHEPTYFNKGILSGYTVGMAATLVLGLVSATLTTLSLPAIASGAALFTLGGMVIGSVMQHAHLKRDYDHAVASRNIQYAAAQQQSQGAGVSQYMNSVSPQEAQALSERQDVRAVDVSHTALLDQAAELPQQPLR